MVRTRPWTGSLWERLLSTATDPATPDPGVDLVTGVETGDLFDVGTPVDQPTAALDDLPDASPLRRHPRWRRD